MPVMLGAARGHKPCNPEKEQDCLLQGASQRTPLQQYNCLSLLQISSFTPL